MTMGTFARLRALVKIPRRALLPAGTVMAVAVVAVLPFAMQASAVSAPELTAASSVTTRDAVATATATCGRGYSAVGVSAEITGFADVRISKMWPQGRTATARGTASAEVTSPWTLKVQATCVKNSARIETRTATAGSGTDAAAGCGPGRTLVGFGFAAGGDGRLSRLGIFDTGSARPRGGYPTGGYPTGGYPTGGYPTGGYPTGEYPTGGYPTGEYPGTGEYPTGEYPTGEYPGTGEYPTGEYPSTGEYPTGEYPTGEYPGTGEYPTGGYPTGEYPGTGEYPTGEYPTGEYPGTGEYPTGEYPGTGEYPTGEYPTGGYPTGGYPTGGYPTGGYPTGEYPGTGEYPTGEYPGTGEYPTGEYPGTGEYPTGGYPIGRNGERVVGVLARTPRPQQLSVIVHCSSADFGITAWSGPARPGDSGTTDVSLACPSRAKVAALGATSLEPDARLRALTATGNGATGRLVLTHTGQLPGLAGAVNVLCGR